jgi:hypothetical protein
MWVVASRAAVLSVITGGGKWVEITTHADPLYQHPVVPPSRKFWRCVESGEPPRLFGVAGKPAPLSSYLQTWVGSRRCPRGYCQRSARMSRPGWYPLVTTVRASRIISNIREIRRMPTRARNCQTVLPHASAWLGSKRT